MGDWVGPFLFLLTTIDPIGTLTLFVGLTSHATPAERRRIALRATFYSAIVLVGFILVGQIVLGELGVRLEAFQLAGGLIFFLFGVQMVFGIGAAGIQASGEAGHDVAVFPIAVPSIASPGSILAVVLLTDNREFTIAQQATTTMLLAVVLAITYAGMLLGNRVYGLIGNAGASLLVRVMGLLLTSLAVEMVLEAVAELMGNVGTG